MYWSILSIKLSYKDALLLPILQWMEAGRGGGTGANAVCLVEVELKHVIAPAPTRLWPMVADLVLASMRRVRTVISKSSARVGD